MRKYPIHSVYLILCNVDSGADACRHRLAVLPFGSYLDVRYGPSKRLTLDGL